ncbi:hypothetical protein [Bowmanella sp. JS7-9]|uniref:Uncharacterized protein n=1 Tax=Pseudobowmanella zhangzhouensis TaxID=1537679 RepID=A0ABW1XJS5_9ALTE|nr:hypothetical protein [Bowmanella sp. JS7-9]
MTYITQKRRTARYQSLQRAHSAIRSWLDKQDARAQAILYVPGELPQSFTCQSQLPEQADKATNFYNTQEWKALRLRAFERHGNQCLCCGAGYDKELCCT